MLNKRLEPGALLLRSASENDINLFVQVIRLAFAEHRGRLDPPSGANQETAESIRERLKAGFAILAQMNGEAAGCVNRSSSYYDFFPIADRCSPIA